jgi:MEMO1 family protein
MPRQPAVHGQFYPAEPFGLKATVEAYMAQVDEPKQDALGLMAPHAGYPFSGAVAGRTFGAVNVPDTVLILNPSHRFGNPALAVWTGGDWLMPMGPCRLHDALTRELVDSPLTTAADEPHLPEHSGEVLLPFIQAANPQARIAVVCITVAADAAILKEFGAAIPAMLAACGAEDALVVASSDMSHESGAGAADVVKAHDDLAVERLLAMDPDGLLDVCEQEKITMCGRLPAAAMLVSAMARGATSARLTGRATSADTPRGAGDYIVGYTGLLVQ